VLPGTRRCPSCALSPNTIERIDELSGRIVAKIRFRGEFAYGAIDTDKSSVWVLDRDGTLIRVDPASNRVTGRFATGATEAYILATGGGYEWICECFNNHVLLRYDATAHTAKAFQLLRSVYAPAAKASTYRPRTFVVGLDDRTGFVWLLGAAGATLVPWNQRGQAAPATGVAGDPVQAVLARGSIWVAAGGVVDRFSLTDGKRVTIEMPGATYASGIAVDPITNAVWVASSTAPVT
jgi:DNA-binding beta-propeller fold protein YncE